ncbi:hypothetical protein B0H19DRAFT_923104, partial [Mycena capillaripes]
MPTSSVPAEAEYPPPAWKWEPISDALLRRAIGRMRPYKATYPDSISNSVFVQNTNLLIPFIGPIFRTLDTLKHYPRGWADILSLVL